MRDIKVPFSRGIQDPRQSRLDRDGAAAGEDVLGCGPAWLVVAAEGGESRGAGDAGVVLTLIHTFNGSKFLGTGTAQMVTTSFPLTRLASMSACACTISSNR
jgi:hypothetical protein